MTSDAAQDDLAFKLHDFGARGRLESELGSARYVVDVRLLRV